MTDMVNHPAHYSAPGGHEVIKCLEAWGLHANAHVWNAVKYIARAGKKDPAKHLEDLKKARWYLDYEIERLTREGAAPEQEHHGPRPIYDDKPEPGDHPAQPEGHREALRDRGFAQPGDFARPAVLPDYTSSQGREDQ